MVFRNIKRMMSDEEAFATILGMLLGLANSILGAGIGMACGPFNIFFGCPTWWCTGGWASVCAGVGGCVGVLADVIAPIAVVALPIIAVLVVVIEVVIALQVQLTSCCCGALGMPFFGTTFGMLGGK
jgi:hypothetical protein